MYAIYLRQEYEGKKLSQFKAKILQLFQLLYSFDILDKGKILLLF